MVKQTLQAILLEREVETAMPCLAAGAGFKLLAKIMRALRTLAASLQGRRRRATVESFIPRQSHECESRLEFERFIHW